MVSIREAKEDDLAGISVIENELFKPPYPDSDLAYFLGNYSFTKVWVLEEENIIIGFCMLLVLFDQAQVVKIGVTRAQQKKGYGQLLMETMIKNAKANDCENITLEVRQSNNRALDFYYKQGFHKLALRKDYYQQPSEDGYLLGRGL